MPFGVDFEPDTGNSGSIRINYHRLYFGEAAQKSVILIKIDLGRISYGEA